MVVTVSMLVLVLMLAYSTCKTIEYHEIIEQKRKYRNAVIALNSLMVLVIMLFCLYTLRHGEAINQR